MEEKIADTLLGTQFAYRRKRSANAMLRRIYTDLQRATSFTESVSTRGLQQHHAAFLSLDCSNAFNAAPIDPIVTNLLSMGVAEVAGIQNWLGTATEPRMQCLKGSTDWLATSSGVPQGSVLGPILWLVFLDPILEKANQWTPNPAQTATCIARTRGLYAFADDISLFTSGLNLPHFGGYLRNWASSLVNDLTAAGIPLSNKSTAHTVRFLTGSGRNDAPFVVLPATNGHPPVVTTNEPWKLLGYQFDCTLSSKSQKDAVAKKVHPLMSRLFSISRFRHPADTRTLYMSYILPHLTLGASCYVDLNWNFRRPAPMPSASRGELLPGGRRGTVKLASDANKRAPKGALLELEKYHSRAATYITGTVRTSSRRLRYREAGLYPLHHILQKLCTREDEIASRTPFNHASLVFDMTGLPAAHPNHFGIKPVPTLMPLPLLRCLPYHPAWAGTHCDQVRFFTDTMFNKANRSKEELSSDNSRRLRNASTFLGTEFYIMATDGSVTDARNYTSAAVSGADSDPDNTPAAASVRAGKTITIHSGIHLRSRAAGAAVLYDNLDREIATSRKPAGTRACSYSAECTAAESGWLDLAPAHVPDGSPIMWITDSRSLLQALEKGCLSQTSFTEARLWHAILKFAAKGCKVACVFVFSHTDGLVPNDRADELASIAASEIGDFPAPLWYIDAARSRYAPRRKGYIKSGNETNEFGTLDQDYRTLEPLQLERYRRLTPAVQKLLSCLRTGVWSHLGLLQNTITPCRLCNTPVAQRRGIIRHMFECQSPEAVAARAVEPHLLYSEQSLWTRDVPTLRGLAAYAVRFKRAFLQQAL
eukprot:GILJ01020861.1.p1 GENE.GILJ01020861.1~~GILJ01020861.1.p1  ORF type:complete len:952 (-),score=74.26 GILJ01020861.1:123-2585(-)